MQGENSNKRKRKYDASVKAEVVHLIASGRSVSDIARSLGIGENIIYRWRKEALQGATPAAADMPTTAGSAHVSLSEHLALQKRLREVEMERDILKEAVGIFSKPQ